MHTVADPLRAKGIATKAGGGRYAFCAVDWCGLSNSPLLLFRRASANAIGARLQHVLVHTVRQHAGPYLDADAYDLLRALRASPTLPVERLVTFAERLSVAAKSAMKCLMPFDRMGTIGVAVERVASAR